MKAVAGGALVWIVLFIFMFSAPNCSGQDFESLVKEYGVESSVIVDAAKNANTELAEINKSKEARIADANKIAESETAIVITKLIEKAKAAKEEAIKSGNRIDADKISEFEKRILATTGEESELPTNQLRVMTFNIHHCQGLDGKTDIDRIAKIINDAQPDVVALQEVDVKTKRSNGVDQAKEIAKRCGMEPYFGRTIDLTGGHYGNAILSNRKVVAIQNFALPKGGKENRAAIAATFEVNAKQPVTIVSTHFDHSNDRSNVRTQSAVMLAKLIKQSKVHVIVAGDLNCTPDSSELEALTKLLKSPSSDPLLTFPAVNPTKQIDYIMVDRRANWTTLSVEVLDGKGASDHRPVLAVFQSSD